VNLSLGDFSPQPTLGNALSALAESSLLIGASGNRRHQLGPGGADTNYPESHPDVITVGATDSADALGYFSDTGNALDFTAPGVAIYTASWEDPDNPLAFHVGDGTSFACPMVSGIASLGLSIRPAMTRAELVYALKESAVDLGAPGKDPDFGWGRVNAYQALVMIRELVFFDDFESGNLSAWSVSVP
jgi:subtilisin family serine protease